MNPEKLFNKGNPCKSRKKVIVFSDNKSTYKAINKEKKRFVKSQ